MICIINKYQMSYIYLIGYITYPRTPRLWPLWRGLGPGNGRWPRPSSPHCWLYVQECNASFSQAPNAELFVFTLLSFSQMSALPADILLQPWAVLPTSEHSWNGRVTWSESPLPWRRQHTHARCRLDTASAPGGRAGSSVGVRGISQRLVRWLANKVDFYDLRDRV